MVGLFHRPVTLLESAVAPIPLCLQQPSPPQCTLQRRLHLYVLELGDGEVEVLDGGVVLK